MTLSSHSRSFFSASRRRRSQAGIAIVETLIFIPTIFILTFIALEVTNILRVYEKTSWTAEYAVRQASEGMFEGDKRYSPQVLRTKIYVKLYNLVGNQYIKFGDVFCLHYYKQNENPDESSLSCGAASDQSAEDFEPGDLVRVKVHTHYVPMLGVFERLFPGAEELVIGSTFDRVISAPSG